LKSQCEPKVFDVFSIQRVTIFALKKKDFSYSFERERVEGRAEGEKESPADSG